MRHAGRQPLRQCLISCNWRGLTARIVVARDAPEGIVAAVFTVDRGCRGVTEAHSIPALREDEYVSLLDDVRSRDLFQPALQPATLDLAAKLIEAAVDYGAELGFRPPESFRAARQMLHGAHPERCPEDARCGRPDGRPFFSPEIDEDPEPVLRVLTARLGSDGFDYLPPFTPTSRLNQRESWAGERPAVVRFDCEDLKADASWRRLRVTAARLIERVVDYGVNTLDEEMLDYAWCDFDPASAESMIPEEDPRYYTWFLPWAAFAWQPFDDLGHDDGLEPDRANWPRRPLGLELLEACREQLDPLEQRFLETVCARPYSFYRITDIQPGQTLELEDLLTGKRRRVNERTGTKHVHRHGILYARILSMGDHAIIESGGPYEIPASFANAIRERSRVGAPDLHNLALEITDHLEMTGPEELEDKAECPRFG